PQEIRNELSKIKAQGATNVCDAFLRAYLDVPERKRDEVSYVYFSDGAPTAARFLFTRGREHNNVLGPSWANYDYLNWGIVDGGVSIPNAAYRTPPKLDLGNNHYWNPRLFTGVDPRSP